MNKKIFVLAIGAIVLATSAISTSAFAASDSSSEDTTYNEVLQNEVHVQEAKEKLHMSLYACSENTACLIKLAKTFLTREEVVAQAQD